MRDFEVTFRNDDGKTTEARWRPAIKRGDVIAWARGWMRTFGYRRGFTRFDVVEV